MAIVARPTGVEPVTLPPEIGFLLAQGVPLRTLRAAHGLARAAGTDAATALLAGRLVGEEAFYRGLARTLGLPFLTGTIALGDGTRYPESVSAGAAPLAAGGPGAFVLAPRGRAVADLLAGGAGPGRVAVTTPTRLRDAVFAARPVEIARQAAEGLDVRRPEWSCRPGPGARHVLLALLAVASVLGLSSQPTPLGYGLLGLLQTGILTMLAFRLAAVLVPAATRPAAGIASADDVDLPVYTVMAALHREAEVVPQLVSALARLDYPESMIQRLFVVEAHDTETRAALEAVRGLAAFDVVVAPPGLPRTKPRALNVALPQVRGALLVVYDAEDIPEADQLRIAAATFAAASERTACIQGRLVIHNADHSWLTRCFALEYAALFDVVCPALATWGLPMPLGGTTTHFRTRALRTVHGWDAWNVTEDADLGMRFARAGYAVGDLPSATLEEAPTTVRAWLPQRARWLKGFMVTTWTLARRPMATTRDLGPAGTLCALALLPGTVLSALLYPLTTLLAVRQLLDGPALPAFLANLPVGIAWGVLAGGVAAMLVPAWCGARRRGLDGLRYVPLLPLYYGLVSLAAWMALVELIRDPFRWNKTEHGHAPAPRGAAFAGRGRLTSARSARSPLRPANARG